MLQRHRRSRKRILSAAVLAAGTAMATPTSAAQMTFDLRAPGYGKIVPFPTVGQVVSLDLYVVLHSANSTQTDDGFTQTQGAFYSSNGGLLGNLRGDSNSAPPTKMNNVAPFDSGTSHSGYSTPNDAGSIDSDGDIDVGASVNAGTFAHEPWFTAAAIGATSTIVTGTLTIAGDLEFLIGRTTFTVTGGSGNTSINYLPRLRTDASPALNRMHLFHVDGFDYRVDGNGNGITRTGTNPFVAVSGTLAIGDPVTFGVPEPASVGLLGIAATSMLRRRRKI